ncbi:MAG: OmpA family protein [Kiritimatiellae bacterium]|nr:OmpA family protein [Kiritimatiellia bacterium]
MRNIHALIIFTICCSLGFTAVGCKKFKVGKKNVESIDGLDGVVIDDLDAFPLDDRIDIDGVSEGESSFDTVYFGYDSAQIQPSERSKIESVAEHLNQNRSGGIAVEGHSDERGSREYNLALGERRALAVRAYLIGLGVDGSRIQTKSMGEEDPVSFGHDEESWGANRRSEFVILY